MTGVDTGTINGINFQNFTTLLGGGLTDTVQGSNADDDFLITNPDQVQVGNLTFTGVETLDGVGGNDRFILAGGTLSGSIIGGAGTDTLVTGNTSTQFVVTGTDSGTVNSITGGFSTLENLTGGTAEDSFSFAGGTLSGIIDGGAGNDSLLGSTGDDRFELASTPNAGTFSGTNFINLETIDGNSGTDTVEDSNNIGAIFILTGTDNAFLESQSNLTFTNVEIAIGSPTATNTIVGTPNAETFSLTGNNSLQVAQIAFSNINAIEGNGGDDLLQGTAGADRFTLSAVDAGETSGLTFTGIANLDGLAGDDTLEGFDQDSTIVITALDAGTHSQLSGAFTRIENLSGGAGNDTFTLRGGTLTGAIDGNTGSDTLVADNLDTTIDIAGTDRGTIGGISNGWSNIENIIGGTGNDTFFLSANTLTGSLDGGGGSDTIVGDAVANTFVLLTTNGGTVTGILGTFSNIENLVGNIESDTFILASAGNLTGVLDGSDNLDTLIGDDNGNLFVLTGLDTGYVNDRIPNFVNIENLTGGSGSDLFFVEDRVGLSGLVDGGAGIDYLIANNVANLNIEGYVLPELINLDSFNAPEKGLYDVYVGDGERKVIEVADLDQSQIIAYDPENFGNPTIAGATASPTTAGDFTPDADNELPPLDAGAGDVESPLETGTVEEGVTTGDLGNGATARNGSQGSESRAVPDPNTGTGSRSGTAAGFTPDADNELPPLDVSANTAEGNLPDPNVNASNADDDLPDPNASASNSDEQVPDPTAAGADGASGGDSASIASAPGITAESPTEGQELPIGMILLGVGAVVGAAGVAAAVVSGTTGGGAAGSAAQSLQSALQNLQKLLPGGLGGAALGTAVAASQAQQKLAEMKIALEPRVTDQPNLIVRKEGGASLTQAAIDLADKEAIEEGLLGESFMEKVATLKEFFGMGEEEEETAEETQKSQASNAEAAAETPESEATESEAIDPNQQDPQTEEETNRIEAVKAKIAEAAERAGLPPASLEYLYTAAIEKIGEILEEIEIAPDILSAAWGKSLELMEYRDLLEDAAPGESVMIPLVNHEVLSEQAPSIDLKFKETLVGQFEIVITFGSVLEGVMLAIEDRKIKRLQVGSATATGGIEFSGLPLFEVPEKSLDWNKVIDLGEGIAIDRFRLNKG
ncbi:MAG: beta strand repeat-containing protein [Prochlorotrichaceae cyanobacterium]